MKYLLVLLMALSFFACSFIKASFRMADDKMAADTLEAVDQVMSPEDMSTDESYENRVKYVQTELSNQFDIAVDFTRVRGTTSDYYNDSSVLKLFVRDKESGACLDSLFLTSDFYFDFFFQDKTNTTSYSTGYNSDNEFSDNYFGDIVVADFNFDRKDDIAVINDGGGNGGVLYSFFIQTENKKFVLDKFLTDTMVYFPITIDRKKQRLTTIVHASAVSVSKKVYHYDTTTKSWKCLSHRIIGM